MPKENGKTKQKSEFPIFVNRRKIEVELREMTGQQVLEKAGFEGKEWDLLKLQGEGDTTGGTLLLFNQAIALKPGNRFRAIPGNRTFGS